MDEPSRTSAVALRAAQRGDERALAEVAARYLPLVRRVAGGYASYGLELDDLVQEGSIGLLHAIDAYAPASGVPFEAYAAACVRHAVCDALTEDARTIRLPKQVVDARRAAARAGEPADAREVPAATASLDQAVTLDGTPLGALLADDASPDPEREAARERMAERVRALLDDLPARQRELVRRRYGFDGANASIAEVAHELGVSVESARRVERDALDGLRLRLEGRRRRRPPLGPRTAPARRRSQRPLSARGAG